MPDCKDNKLVTALRQAKGTPMFFAFVAKGTSDGTLLVEKKKISVKDINEAKKESGGKQVFQGRCIGEDGKLIFEMGKEAPSTLAKQLKAVIHDAAGMMLQTETRVASDLAESQEEEGGENEAHESTTLPSGTGTGNEDPGAARFATRLKSLTPILSKMNATGSPQVKNVKDLLGEANNHYRTRAYEQANAVLDRVETLIKQLLLSSEGTPGPTTSATDAAEGANRFAARLKALAPVIQKVESTGVPQTVEIKAAIVEANTLFRNKDVMQANATLDRAEKLIKQALTAGMKPGVSEEIPAALLKQLQDALQAYQDASDTVDRQISQLQSAMKATGDEDFSEIADKGLNAITGNYKVRLMAVLHEARNAQGKSLKKLAIKGAGLATSYQEHMESDERVEACDGNPFGVSVNIRPTLNQALTQLMRAFDAISKA